MAVAEDAAAVLEQFVQDVANLPAEIAHLLEEIEAKDKIMQECRNNIQSRDSSIQKYKSTGSGQTNPKEESYCTSIIASFDKAQTLQEEKVSLGDKARILLDRQIKRLDIQIKSLESAGILPPDPELPSLLPQHLHSAANNRIPPLSASTTGTSTPLAPIHGNAGSASSLPSHPINNAALARLAQQSNSGSFGQPSSRRHSPGPTTPTSAGVGPSSALARSARESSIDAKRRRLANQPTTSSSLRQSSLGPTTSSGTTGGGAGSAPGTGGGRAGTPTSATGSGRAGSAGPSAGGGRSSSVAVSGGGNSGAGIKKNAQKGGPAPPARVSSLNPAAAKKSWARRKGGSGYQRKGGSMKPSPSDGDESGPSEAEASGSERHSRGRGASGAAPAAGLADNHDTAADVDMGGMDEDEDEDGGDGDDRKYCTCRSVSYGNMVACDNDDCEFEWFHWSCVGMTREPAGKWYCEACKTKLGLK